MENPAASRTSERYDVNLGIVSWEIDFFGRIRSLEERALEAFLATEAAQRSTQIMIVSAVAEAYLAQYEKAIQTAFREVADALAGQRTLADVVSAQLSLVEAARATYHLAGRRYAKGVDSYLGVLDAQRTLYSAELVLVFLRLAERANQVRLYGVLGGGAS